MELEVRHLIRIDRRDTPADPSHDGDRHRVADRLVARAVRTILGGLSLPGDLRMPIGETLQAFALERGESADDILAPVRAGGRIAPSRQAFRDLCAVLGRCHALSVCAVGSSDHVPPQRQDGRRMPVCGKRVRLLFRIPYRVCSGRSAVLEACARSAASSSAGKLLPLFTARLRIP